MIDPTKIPEAVVVKAMLRYDSVLATYEPGSYPEEAMTAALASCIEDVLAVIDALPDARDERLALHLIEVRDHIKREFGGDG